MTDEQIFQQVAAIICDTAPDIQPEQVVPQAVLKDELGLDSLTRVDLIIGLERTFGIEIPDEAVEQLIRVDDVVDRVRQSLGD